MSDSREKIAELVARFEANYKQYTAPQYNETEVRAQFVDPFFEALGWDVRNQAGRFEVSLETRVQVEEAGRNKPKRPDYGFSLHNQTRFFVETKKPSVNLKNDPLPAYQLRRYGWSAKLPVSILTDFEELIIYDCRVQPSRDDAVQKGRLRYYNFREYVEKWDEIAALFSREAVLENKLEAWVQETKQRGTITVDDAFLNEMETWRNRLAEDIAMHNPGLTRRDLNMAVQTTIDRIVFLRICEDRGVEPYGRLKDYVRGGRVYESLAQLFRQADSKYNSGLFHFSDEKGREQPDTLTLSLNISDDTLQDIIARLYYPTSPYEFSVLPADILGQIYERFLGKVIELTPGGGASVTEKPEVRKAGGVYYTPTYIVDYIVENTVGKLVNPTPTPSTPPLAPPLASSGVGEGSLASSGVGEGSLASSGVGVGSLASSQLGEGSLTPDDVSRLKILDPACGSGSFLIGAYQYLLDWHLQWYIADGAQKHVKAKRLRVLTPPLHERSEMGRGLGGGVLYALTTAEKKRILLNNIYGVDLDQQAVEVTKLSLLLKVLEGETAATAQPELLSERVLPDLGDNIKWGNSLIGPDFYAGKQISMFDEEETYRVKVFDWNHPTDGFGAIMAAGGFDAVIGNPPYIRIQTMTEWAAESVAFYKQRYKGAQEGNIDIYVIFIERGLSLLKANGKVGFIIPQKFWQVQYGKPLRGMLASGKNVERVVNFRNNQVFDAAFVNTCILVLSKSPQVSFKYTEVLKTKEEIGQALSQSSVSDVSSHFITDAPWVLKSSEKMTLLDRLAEIGKPLEDCTARIFQGLKTSADKIYVLDLIHENTSSFIGYSKQLQKEVEVEKGLWHRLIKGTEMRRFVPLKPIRIVLFPYAENEGAVKLIGEDELQQGYSKTYEYLKLNENYLRNRENNKMDHSKWYGYVYPKALDVISLPKIITPDLAPRSSFLVDTKGELFLLGGAAGGYGIMPKSSVNPLYLTGILNSQVLNFFMTSSGQQMESGYYSFEARFIRSAPIRTIDFNDPADKARHDKMVALVQSMLDLHPQLAAAPSPQIQKTVQAVIDQTDREIDALVYELYGLTADEIAIVEGR